MSREPGRTRTLSVVDGRFRCDGCRRWRDAATRTDSGFCCHCITRGKRYWLKQMPLAELLELAASVWPREREKERVTAA